MAQWIAPHRSMRFTLVAQPLSRDSLRIATVLDVGTFSGFSALVWYEATRKTQCEIVTLELSKQMIAVAEDVFERRGVGDRIKMIEGPASER